MNYLFIPDINFIDETLEMCSNYNLNFEYNDFSFPSVYDDKEEVAFFTGDELSCMKIRRGTLTDEERKIMQNNVCDTRQILNKWLMKVNWIKNA